MKFDTAIICQNFPLTAWIYRTNGTLFSTTSNSFQFNSVLIQLILILGTESAWPFIHKYQSLGKINISRLGWFGILLQVCLMFYFMIASVVGLYNTPLFNCLTPRPNKTSMVQIIGNCIVLLILSCALPVSARTLGITNFNLMGGFGQLHWFTNYQMVLFYNLFFEVCTSICLVSKLTKSVRDALTHHFLQYSRFKSWKRWKKQEWKSITSCFCCLYSHKLIQLLDP